MSLQIRPATKDDASLIADISHQTFYETFAGQNRPEDMEKFLSQQFTRGRLIMEVGAKENLFFLAFLGDEIAGYVKLRTSSPPGHPYSDQCLEIARLYAMKKMIGKGVGAALMQKSIDIAREMNRSMVWLGVWEHNERALSFYKKWGFEKFGTTNFLLGDDLQQDWLMKKEL